MGGRGLRADGGPRGLAAGRARDRPGAGRFRVGRGHEGVLTEDGRRLRARRLRWRGRWRGLKATVMRWMSCAVVRMVATAGSSAAWRCTASAPHRAALRPAWSSSGGPARWNAAPVADHGNGRRELQGVAVPGEGRHARPPLRARARRHRRRAARDRGFAGALGRRVSWPASHRVIACSLAWPGRLSTARRSAAAGLVAAAARSSASASSARAGSCSIHRS